MSAERRAALRPSRAVYRRRQVAAGLTVLLVAVLIGAVVVGQAGSGHQSTTTLATTVPLSTTTTSSVSTTTTTDPGTLPQTADEPPMDSASLTTRLEPLWSAIQSDTPATAEAVFFPESAYLTMKRGVLPNPAGDYQSRLIGFLDLDLAAYQRALGQSPSTTVIQTVNANPSLASWIPPGACENTIGYWHLPNVRIVYSVGGQMQSFAVASLISWRGVWYVVHLGPNPRASNVGTVSQPALGAGTPGPGGGC